MSSSYASQTSVSVENSRREIERVLTRFGASAFMYGSDEHRSVIGFVMRRRRIQMVLLKPTGGEVSLTPTGKRRVGVALVQALAQEERRRWRALFLIIKAKLVAIEDGVTTFEDEWAMHMVLPDGRVAGNVVSEAIDQAYALGEAPPLLGITSGRQ